MICLGWVLAIFWWAAAGQWKQGSIENVFTTFGGFPLALLAVWLLSLRKNKPNGAPYSKQKSLLTWLFLAFLYPLVTLIWFSCEIFSIAPMEDFSWLTHPALLVFNLFAVLFIGPLINWMGRDRRLSKQLRKAFTCGNGSVIPAVLWWLWHLPFIFVNGAVLNHIQYSPLWFTLHLLTVLCISFILTWLTNKERREVSSTAF